MRQEKIPGTASDLDPDLEEAGERYHELRAEAKQLAGDAKIAGERLVVLMKDKGLSTYCGDGWRILLDTTEKVKVERIAHEEGEAEHERPGSGVESMTISSGEQSVTLTADMVPTIRAAAKALRGKRG